MTVRVLVDLVDGGLAEFEGEHYLRKYEFLTGRGYTGRQLIHELLGDDWAAPPETVRITDGEKVIAVIPYGRRKR